ncbi:uncharacterized protein LOC116348264 [Contarinia nasturtii]|uniref:uncharacterized protein LOC116348264 n=1 Tax=Contarinia nasturtii TaxID=265458 RepID=UPI0012D4312C|nr:uncharacterized protein LOC116348264 [Contarinia nasturtii]XP_031635043.1 uncharacterized protein LOC116348264 [Contarinia nasturtii]
MTYKLNALLVLSVCQFACTMTIVTTSPSTETFETTIEHFRGVFSSFPCANKTIVSRIFNIMNLALNPNNAHFSGRDAAKTEWLYLMVIGNSSNISIKRWRVILNKILEAHKSQNEEIREKNEQMLEIDLTESQIHRFNLYLCEADKQMTSSDGEIFNRYFFGFPIGLALGVPEEDIKDILEDDIYGNQAIDYLGRLAHLICGTKHPNASSHRTNQNIVRDLREALEGLLNRSQQA